jgi:hypothetical protein
VEPDTVLTVPGEGGVAALTVSLMLDVDQPDLSPVETLLERDFLSVLSASLAVANAPQPSRDHIAHALDHLAAGEVRNAWPPLVIGIEGLFWAEAAAEGYVDKEGRFTAKAARQGKPRSAIDLLLAMPINERVQRFLRRSAFGGSANAFRHGRLHPAGERLQCLIWLLALVAWFDGSLAWRSALSANP